MSGAVIGRNGQPAIVGSKGGVNDFGGGGTSPQSVDMLNSAHGRASWMWMDKKDVKRGGQGIYSQKKSSTIPEGEIAKAGLVSYKVSKVMVGCGTLKTIK